MALFDFSRTDVVGDATLAAAVFVLCFVADRAMAAAGWFPTDRNGRKRVPRCSAIDGRNASDAFTGSVSKSYLRGRAGINRCLASASLAPPPVSQVISASISSSMRKCPGRHIVLYSTAHGGTGGGGVERERERRENVNQ